ncbi:MAG: hypothetical protein GC190_15960 [Alphaproteobacteria bacterium]|nr:hypothetical protein [Alphaproteobacteria bacterium]
MKLRLLVGGLALLAAAAGTSFADTPATTETPAATPATSSGDSQTPATETPATTDGQTAGQPDPNEKICKKDETTGSRISKVCKTRKEWEDDAKNDNGF